ncbi:hypothetical protein V2J09_009214 [Rumex salicifolius]
MSHYFSVVRSLQYISLTSLDIASSVSKLCRFMHQPIVANWQATKRLLRYLQGTQNMASHLSTNSQLSVAAISYSDWANDLRDQRLCCLLYLSKFHTHLLVVQEIVEHLSPHLRFTFLPAPPTLWCDNIGATYPAVKPLFHQQTKNIAWYFHFVRDRLAYNIIQLAFLSTKDRIINDSPNCFLLHASPFYICNCPSVKFRMRG